MAKPKLTAKQEMFCAEYLIDLNATQAAIRAGYSEKTAHSIGNENLIKPSIQEKISELMAIRSEKVTVDAVWVLNEAVKSYAFNTQEVEDSDGNPKMINAASASKFLEMCGRHVNVKAFDGERTVNDEPIHKVQIEVVGAS